MKTEHKIVFTFIDHFPKDLNHSCSEQTSVFLTLPFLQLSFESAFKPEYSGIWRQSQRNEGFTGYWHSLRVWLLWFFWGFFFFCCVGFFPFLLYFFLFCSSSTFRFSLTDFRQILVVQTRGRFCLKGLQFSPFNRKGLI